MTTDLAEIRAAFARSAEPGQIDTETTSYTELWRGLEIRDVALGVGQSQWCLPISRPHSENLPARAVADLLTDLHRDNPGRCWEFFNWKFDAGVLLSTLGVDTRPWDLWDASIGAWLEDENVQVRDLKGRSTLLFGPDARAPKDRLERIMAGPTLSELEDEHYYGPSGRQEGGVRQPMGISRAQAHERALADPRYGRREMWDLTAAEIRDYALTDIVLTRDLSRYQRTLDHRHPIAAAMPREMEVARVLLDMERLGIRVDAGRAEAAHAKAVARMAALDAMFEGINPNSHDQLVDLVHNRWGFPVLHRSPKTNSPSLDRETLELLGDDPRIVALLEQRRLAKAVSAYYRPLLEAVDDNDRIHTSVNQAKVRTGRFSMERPNLQTIPREDTIAEVRAVFVPAPGFELWEYDLAQAEVRVAAAMSHEEALLAALAAGEDLYDTIAQAMGVKRKTAKEVVLANNYGAGPIRLASSLLKGTGRMVTVADIQRADRLQRHLAKTYPRLAATASRAEDIARREGRIPLKPPGRFRHFRGVGYAPEEYRKAFNSLCQGGVAEQMKTLMVELHQSGIWEAHQARLVLQVHDSLVAEVVPGYGEELGTVIQEVLDDVSYYRTVRLPVEAKFWVPAPPPTNRDPWGREPCSYLTM